MDIQYYKKYEPLFNAWFIKRIIGEGSFGNVYEIERREMGQVYHAALKTITIPRNQSEVQSLMADGMSREAAAEYYNGLVQDLINEFVILSKLKGNSHIVSYEDHMLLEHENGIGWDILIRMELLTPLLVHNMDHPMPRQETIKLGIDLCKALELCQRHNIIHRDLKPENIFVSPNGDYKLGDFGIARIAAQSDGGLSQKGTQAYMAPEVYRGSVYGPTVDIYSLGIVLYWLLNENRTPFLPPYPLPITYNDREDALIKRIHGEKIPPPKNGNDRLGEIILKACAWEPKNRFESAKQMRMALEKLAREERETTLSPAKIGQDSEDKACGNNKTRKKRKCGILAGAALLMVIFLTVLYLQIPKEVESITGIKDTLNLYIGENYTPKYKINPERFADERITFSSEDEGVALVSDTGTIEAKRPGTAILRLTVKEYSKRVTIHVMAKVTEISNVDRQIYLQEGERLNLKPQLKPEKFAEEPITYQVKNHKIATVRENGELLGRQAGSTRLVISAGGCQKTVRLQVNPYVPPQPASSYIYREPEKRPSSSESENYEEEINGGEEYWR